MHVTATHCDDPVAVLVAARATRLVSLHGCSPAQAGLPSGRQAMLFGGRDAALKSRLMAAFDQHSIEAIDAADTPDLGGDRPAQHLQPHVHRGRGTAGADHAAA
ncbi:poly-gamma-glutamate hydrolase family protein [Actinoplanes sp. NPDC089786]|uniref:poly-gamma-glutamate hydrolase family protein n=1 Tax=Actinoplanes sp. NPDC089786 TaxID=3155185 RepID=UPI003423F012